MSKPIEWVNVIHDSVVYLSLASVQPTMRTSPRISWKRVNNIKCCS